MAARGRGSRKRGEAWYVLRMRIVPSQVGHVRLITGTKWRRWWVLRSPVLSNDPPSDLSEILCGVISTADDGRDQ